VNGSRASRIVVAGLSGDSGKTLVSLALALGARDRGVNVRGFKKGPDYIDASWLAWATTAPARNLDTFLMGDDGARRAFGCHAARGAGAGSAVLNLIEGNRGLFDGMDAAGTHSTAALAEVLASPVLLVIDARKMTGTAAALVRGCQVTAPRLRIGGVVLNRVAGGRHETVTREAIERGCGVRVLGAVPRLEESDLLPGRHLGLLTPHEHDAKGRLAERLRTIAREALDLDRILECAEAAPSLDDEALQIGTLSAPGSTGQPVTIGYLSDSAFSFYYPENLEALEARGARLAPLSSLSGDALPVTLDALYIGGGFPETHAARLSVNTALLDSLRARAAAGLPIYAECGGLMLLANSVSWQGVRHEMAGVLPVDVVMLAKPQGHGYVVLSVDRPNPFFEIGREIRAHEFHYSHVTGDLPATACSVLRGTGCGGGRDAMVTGSIWASYAHMHAGGTPEWADGMVAAARRYNSRAGDGGTAAPHIAGRQSSAVSRQPGSRGDRS
jgi:cobyrinic acid a,c-diamide synthase